MPSPRIFSHAELQVARTMHACKESWRAIGRTLGCQAETIRCAIDPDYKRDRFNSIIAGKRKRNRAAKESQAAKDARSAQAYSAYQPSRAGQASHPKRLGSIARVTNLRGFV